MDFLSIQVTPKKCSASDVLRIQFYYSIVGVTTAAAGLLFSIGLDQFLLHYTSINHTSLGALAMDTISSSNDENMNYLHELSPLTSLEISTEQRQDESLLLAKLYVLEAAIALHSVILGFGFGVLDPTQTLRKAPALVTALSLHQFFEGMGLSTTILSMLKNKQDRNITISFGMIFSLTFPVGATFGLYNVSDTYESILLQGFANAFAGGFLLHAALVEMISADFSNRELLYRPLLKASMFGFLITGFALMAVLAGLE